MTKRSVNYLFMKNAGYNTISDIFANGAIPPIQWNSIKDSVVIDWQKVAEILNGRLYLLQ